MAEIFASRRVRHTPFTQGVVAAGVKAYTVYNRMLLPTTFASIEEDYHHLKSAVQIWDVACERQVQVKGPDARRLIGLLTPRDLSMISESRCLYIPVTDQNGGMLNDPVLVQAAADTYWISIADSDLLMWVKAIAACNDFNVEVCEPDVSPLGIQGPKSDDLMAAVFGDGVRALRPFGCGRFDVQGREMLIARSGYSKQGGFEIYLEGSVHGMGLWHILMEAGKPFDVRAGCPNLIERIEGGLLSYGNDMTNENTVLECGLGKFVSAERLGECFGGRAMREELEAGSKQMIRAIEIGGGPVPVCDHAWPVMAGGRRVGQVTSAAWSPDFKTNVAIGMVDSHHWDAGTELKVETPDQVRRAAVVREEFWG